MEFTGNRKCQDCGGLFPPGEIHFAPDPFAYEIRGDETPRWQCWPCARLSRDEI